MRGVCTLSRTIPMSDGGLNFVNEGIGMKEEVGMRMEFAVTIVVGL